MIKKCKHCSTRLKGQINKEYCSKKCYNKYYWKNKEVKQKNLENKRNIRFKRKKELVELKGGACIKCGYNKSIQALDFHHTSGQKETTISKILTNKIEASIRELKKCILLCSNCHIKEHNFLKIDRKDYQNKLRMFLQEKLGGKCSNCKTSDPRLLEFHHVNPSDKEFSISKAISSRWNIEKVRKEAEKCTLLCSNCHREHHDLNFSKKIKMKKFKISQKDVDFFNQKNGKERSCKMCSNIFYTTRHSYFFCSNNCFFRYNKGEYNNFYVKTCNNCNREYLSKSKTRINCDECYNNPIFQSNKLKNNVKQRYTHICNNCSNKHQSFKKKSIYCSTDCSNKSFRKYKGKSLIKLKNTYIKYNYNLVKTGLALNISANSVKKNLKKHFPNEWINWQKIKMQMKENLKHHNCKSCSKKILKSNGKYCSTKCKDKFIKRYTYDKNQITKKLKNNNGNISKTANNLNISRKALSNWIKKNI